MSDLVLGLLVLGGLLFAGVVLYNRLQERRAERAFRSEHADTLMEKVAPAPRREPGFSTPGSLKPDPSVDYVIELGFPFSDPLADGPVIQRASERALARGMRTRQCLECLAATRALIGDTPIVPMTYAALLEAYGWDRFAADAASHGATTLIVSDVPAGQRPELRRVHLVAPTSTDERIRLAASTTDGWLYLVTLTGTTGARAELSTSLAGLAQRVRAVADGLPLYAGFGISTPEHAAAAAELVDGVIVGSRAVEVAEEGPGALAEYVASLRAALDVSG